MGPLNEFQRRWLDVAQQHHYLKLANAGGPPPESFGYVSQIGSATNQLTSGATQQSIITIQADAWFLWEYVSTAVICPTAAGLTDPSQFTDAGNMLLQISLPGMGDDLYSIPAGVTGMPATLSTGSPTAASAGVPYMFPTPVLLPPNTNVNVSVTKLGTNVGNDNPDPLGFYIMLNGTRIQVWN